MKLSDTIVHTFFIFQNELKLYHWRTHSYARHKASDDLFQSISSLVDQFIESYMGTKGRVTLENKWKTLEIRTYDDKHAVELLTQFSEFIFKLRDHASIRSEPSLLNILDEMLSSVQKTSYLFTLH